MAQGCARSKLAIVMQLNLTRKARAQRPLTTVFAGSLCCVLLSACAAEENSEPASPSSDGNVTTAELSAQSLTMAQTAWLSVSVDGVAYTTFLDPDGRYRDVNGADIIFAGKWEQNAGGQLCFTPDNGRASCWAHGSPGLNGVMRATNEAGYSIELKRIAYTPPPIIEESEPEDSQEPVELASKQAKG